VVRLRTDDQTSSKVLASAALPACYGTLMEAPTGRFDFAGSTDPPLNLHPLLVCCRLLI